MASTKLSNQPRAAAPRGTGVILVRTPHDPCPGIPEARSHGVPMRSTTNRRAQRGGWSLKSRTVGNYNDARLIHYTKCDMHCATCSVCATCDVLGVHAPLNPFVHDGRRKCLGLLRASRSVQGAPRRTTTDVDHSDGRCTRTPCPTGSTNTGREDCATLVVSPSLNRGEGGRTLTSNCIS